ncbi:non-structural maintenance of chromosomes element 1 homolog [Anopheles bellator]|uniref:non-structural maintenance of chromosomes element 1 homolog n=1 Tax=Anopheles bellator TaxID=139047 RepID=UPI0026486D55|nr:non-structural maintenance of chromosomes element 1 homolog [Anopheles bellator]
MAEYTDVHRAFLQAVSNHGTIGEQQAYNILVNIYARYGSTESVPNEEDVAEVVAMINTRIARFDQKICYIHYEPTDMDYVVFVNLIDTPATRVMHNFYTEPELHYFRYLLRELVQNPDHQLPLIACLNFTTLSAGKGGKPIAKTRAESLLSDWEQYGYFLMLEDKCYLGPRTITEFETYLSTHFPDEIKHCSLCNITIYYGVRCAHCSHTLHKKCMQKYLRKFTNCPACKGLWTVKL